MSPPRDNGGLWAGLRADAGTATHDTPVGYLTRYLSGVYGSPMDTLASPVTTRLRGADAPAPPAQVGELQFVNDVVGIDSLTQNFFPLLVAARAAVGFQRPGLIEMQSAKTNFICFLV